jgi:hypothetical protein
MTHTGTVGTMTGSESRLLLVNARVIWNADKEDAGTIIDRDWAGVTIKWDSREQQTLLHNDMAMVSKV